MRAFATVLFTSLVLVAAPAMAQAPEPAPAPAPEAGGSAEDTNMQILKEKLQADKKLLVASNMELTDAEAKKFWPLYDAYQKELHKINDRLETTIKAYAKAYDEGKGSIPDDSAKKLLNEALSVQEAEVKLKRSYAEKISKVLPWTKTARYIQIENKVRALINFELARQIPLVY